MCIESLDESCKLELGSLPCPERSVLRDVLGSDAVRFQMTAGQHLLVLGSLILREAPFRRHEDLEIVVSFKY